MRKKSSRRSFLKSTLALSAAGLTFPQASCAAAQVRYITVRDLYDMAVESSDRGDDLPLLKQMMQNGVQQTLERRGLSLFRGCDTIVQDLIDKHKAKGEEKDLDQAITENRWGLRRPGQGERWNSACPWADCP